MLIGELANSGAAPALEQVLRFAAQRQRVLAHNIANLETPDFRPLDVSPLKFQESLRKAIAERRQRTGGELGELHVESTDEVEQTESGSLRLLPKTSSGNILYHDRNNRDLERLMQGLAENTFAYRTAGDLLRRHNDMLRSAISQRP